MANSSDEKLFSTLEQIAHLLQEDDAENKTEDPMAAPDDNAAPATDSNNDNPFGDLGDLNLGNDKDEKAPAPEEDAVSDEGEAEPAPEAADDGEEKTVSSNSEDVINIINDCLKQGKKVHIEISNEGKTLTKDEYKALVGKKKAGEKISKKDVKKMEAFEAESKKVVKKKAKDKDSLVVEAIQMIVDKVNSLEDKIDGKKALKTVSESVTDANEIAELLKPIDESIEKLDNIIKTQNITDINKKVMKNIVPVISMISEAATNTMNKIDYYTMLKEQQAIDEAANALAHTQSVLKALTEDSAMSANADTFVNTYTPIPVEAPKYIDNKFGASQKPQQSDFYGDETYSKESIPVYQLPISKNIETGKLNPASAMSAIAEAFTEDGILNIDEASKAFLYQKVRKPKTLSDFCLPIAAIEEGKLVAVPKFIKTNAKILMNENSMTNIYKIPSDKIDEIRSKLAPYLTEMGEDIPWEE